MMERVDVAIVGGGVIGSAIAFNLLSMDPGLSVLVVERDPTYRMASSALSASSIRQQFSTPLNIAMSVYGMAFMKDIAAHLSVDGEAPELDIVERGYLYLATETGLPILEANHQTQRQQGVDVAFLTPTALGQRFPWLATGDLAAGSLGLSGEGWFDGYSLLQAFRRKARSLGAVYRTGEAVAFEADHGRVTAIVLDDGTRIACGKLVNAAGPQAGEVAKRLGIALPVVPEKHCVFVFDCKESLADCPLVIDPSGLYFRPEGNRYIAGPPPRDPSEAGHANLDVEYDLFDDVVWPTLAARVPAFEAIKMASAWAGYYEMNTFDQNAILGTAPGIENCYFANGFSGHGMQQSPAVGRGIAELILYGEYRALDLRLFDFGRLLTRSPVRELNII
ncbi:MAG TPA: FAD-binding oxidoreductase [Aliidongia sp.]|uniref:NAD(P)/FAD-dependent oxidoreductase n=1 Tax=Aliidongia sp. TaxID=1914230 RepID=UPI002DDD8D5D|nr:FAD-binding oxidoreductase [Aliidongia sp.]HEV2678416.1 FAD-binding oxidoreductase [Aliidongia sp.]